MSLSAGSPLRLEFMCVREFVFHRRRSPFTSSTYIVGCNTNIRFSCPLKRETGNVWRTFKIDKRISSSSEKKAIHPERSNQINKITKPILCNEWFIKLDKCDRHRKSHVFVFHFYFPFWFFLFRPQTHKYFVFSISFESTEQSESKEWRTVAQNNRQHKQQGRVVVCRTKF